MKTEVEKSREKEVAKIRGGISIAEKRLRSINETKTLVLGSANWMARELTTQRRKGDTLPSSVCDR